jgi:cellulose synthase/poly-beta-1,6-N-acetylglucosamine synthase-like glycosyltransferase
MSYFLFVSCCLSVILLVLGLIFSKKSLPVSQPFLGKISVLIAARNEEKYIVECLKSVVNQTLPKGVDYEILVGDDDSTDDTYNLVSQFIDSNATSTIRLYKITTQLGNAKAKSNVLAQLAHHAQGSLFVYTDADIVVKPTWLATLLKYYTVDMAVVTGVTYCKSDSFFGRMQNIDWVFSLSMVKFLSDFKIPVTAMGNNMMVQREAYFETGGYENLPFSITEDFQLFHQILKNKKWTFKNVFDPNLVSITYPQSRFISFLNQRKRWMKGVFDLPLKIKLLLFSQVIYYPLIITFFFYSPILALVFAVSKLVIQFLYLRKQFMILELPFLFFDLLMYEFFVPVVTFCVLFYDFFSISIDWKSRKYN